MCFLGGAPHLFGLKRHQIGHTHLKNFCGLAQVFGFDALGVAIFNFPQTSVCHAHLAGYPVLFVVVVFAKLS